MDTIKKVDQIRLTAGRCDFQAENVKGNIQMHVYHGSSEHARREPLGLCRCQSGGRTYESDELISRGLIRDPRNLDNPLTSDEIGKGPPRPFMFIYAINETHRFKMAPDGDRTQVGAVKHETLFQNSHVLAAGEVWVVNGIIVDINDESGSYSTRTVMYSDPQFARDVLAALDRGNIPASETVLAKLRNLGGVE